VRGSRFHAWLAPVSDPDDATASRAARAEAAPDATHHCWGWRVWDRGRIEGAGFDVGEPAGTAGRPILRSLERADVVQAVCVVSRWFGGVKLGTGGLARAYGEAAGAAVDAAREMGALAGVSPRTVFRIAFEYPLSGAVGRVVAAHGGRESAAVYGARVELEVSVASHRAGAFLASLGEATGGAASVREVGSRLESE
jgi:putative IMPACT (imprinted ancient) family translation regulator